MNTNPPGQIEGELFMERFRALEANFEPGGPLVKLPTALEFSPDLSLKQFAQWAASIG